MKIEEANRQIRIERAKLTRRRLKWSEENKIQEKDFRELVGLLGCDMRELRETQELILKAIEELKIKIGGV